MNNRLAANSGCWLRAPRFHKYYPGRLCLYELLRSAGCHSRIRVSSTGLWVVIGVCEIRQRTHDRGRLQYGRLTAQAIEHNKAEASYVFRSHGRRDPLDKLRRGSRRADARMLPDFIVRVRTGGQYGGCLLRRDS